MKKVYDIAAYVWPAYTGDEPRTKMFWPEGIGEWQSVKNSSKKENGYFWNRKPLWGYVNEADPYVMEMEIEAATSHGVNVFIYDWYWFEGQPFLEQCLDNGFLKARNNSKMKFYIMWANHDVNYTWDIRNSHIEDVNLWKGTVTEEGFKKIGKLWLEKYLHNPLYYCIDGKPVICIYDLNNFVNSFGSAVNARRQIEWLNNEAIKSGLRGLHFQFIKMWGDSIYNYSGLDNERFDSPDEKINILGMDSFTHYQFAHFIDMDRDYDLIMKDACSEWDNLVNTYKTVFYPHVSIGWDNNPRFINYRTGVVKANTPEKFEAMLRLAKDFSDAHNKVPLITINSWNEWTETSYLEPDNLYGYGYLQSIKKVFLS